MMASPARLRMISSSAMRENAHAQDWCRATECAVNRGLNSFYDVGREHDITCCILLGGEVCSAECALFPRASTIAHELGASRQRSRPCAPTCGAGNGTPAKVDDRR